MEKTLVSIYGKVKPALSAALIVVTVSVIVTALMTWAVVWDAIQRVPGNTPLTAAAMIVLMKGQVTVFVAALCLAVVVFLSLRWGRRRGVRA